VRCGVKACSEAYDHHSVSPFWNGQRDSAGASEALAITQQLWQESCCVVTPNSGQSVQTLHQVTDSSKNECGSAAVPLDGKYLVSELYRGPQSLSIEAASMRLDNRDRRCRIRPQLFRGGCG
jgi:hypothetical protein